MISNNTVFVVEAMLGKLARFLRMFGYSALYVLPEKSWKEVLKEQTDKLGRDNIFLLTRSLERKADVPVLVLRKYNVWEQLEELKALTNLTFNLIPEKSRCPIDNGRLEKIESKEQYKSQIPLQSYSYYQDFFLCTVCGKIYWCGTHWIDMRKKLAELQLSD